MTTLVSSTAVVNVTHGNYWIVHSQTVPLLETVSPEGGNGLAVVGPDLIMVLTGTFFGTLQVTVAIHDAPPPLDPERWDEVVEVSQVAPPGPVCVVEPLDGPPQGLPALELTREEWFRVRVHARGRDAAATHPGVVPHVIEEHLVQLWVAPRGPEARHRLTDEAGRIRRRTSPHP